MILCHEVVALCTAFFACLTDIKNGKVPNRLLFCSLTVSFFCQLREDPAAFPSEWLTGLGIPLLLLGIFFYFGMIGAGDIKLLAVLGTCTGGSRIAEAMLVAMLAALAYSTVFFLRRKQQFLSRITYLNQFLIKFLMTHQRKSYRNESTKPFQFCLTVPILISMIFYAGGFY